MSFGIDNRDPGWWLPKSGKGSQGGYGLLGDAIRGLSDSQDSAARFSRDLYNAGGGVLGYLLGNKNLNRLGDNMLGGVRSATGRPRLGRPQARAVEDETDRRASSALRGQGRGKPSANISGTVRGQLEAPQQRDLAYFLSQAESMMGGGPDYSALRAALTNNAADVDARLSAMYRALENSVDADTEKIGGFYSEANDAVSKSAEQAANNIQQGYEAAQQSQNDELARLGIQDAAAQNTAAAGDQGFQMGQAARSGQVSQNLNTGLSANAKTFNTNMANAAGFEGAEARGFNQRNLASALGELSARESETSAQRRQAAMDMAIQMLQQDQESGQLSIDDRIALERLALDQRKFAADQGAASQASADDRQANARRVALSLIDAGKTTEEIQQILQEWAAAGLI